MPVVLPNPILAKLPVKASWTIIPYLRILQPHKQGGANSSVAPVGIAKKVIVKTDPVLVVTRIDNDGHQIQQWKIGKAQYLINPGENDVCVMSPESPDFMKSDFPELDWIKESNFIGIQNYKGSECWVFKAKVLNATQDELEAFKVQAKETGSSFDESSLYGEKTAFVDSKTRLPVLVSDGEGVFLYTFNSPPAESLIVPRNIQQKADIDAKRAEAQAAGPARPF